MRFVLQARPVCSGTAAWIDWRVYDTMTDALHAQQRLKRSAVDTQAPWRFRVEVYNGPARWRGPETHGLLPPAHTSEVQNDE